MDNNFLHSESSPWNDERAEKELKRFEFRLAVMNQHISIFYKKIFININIVASEFIWVLRLYMLDSIEWSHQLQVVQASEK